MRELVFCHYGPYDFMLDRPGSPRRGIPVPLFNLVYHDCMILPWFMDRQEGEENEEKYKGDQDSVSADSMGDGEGEKYARGAEADKDVEDAIIGEVNENIENIGNGDDGKNTEGGKNRKIREDYMLYALLNGGIPYLDRDGAYPDTDGAFDSAARRRLAEDIDRCSKVTALHERVAKCEMVRHEFPDGNPNHQRTTFSDGTRVTVWLERGEYEIMGV